MKSISIHQAKKHLSLLVERVAEGEEIIITRAGNPVAKLVPYREDAGARQPGYWRGRVDIRDDFDALPDDVAAAFRGETR